MFNLAPVAVPDLSGRTILVTGTGRGIGAALAAMLADHGARVFAGGHGGTREPALDRDGITTLDLDVTRDADVARAVATVGAAAGRLDALVNNAGLITPIGRLADLDSDALLPAFAVNVLGVHRVTRAFLPLLEAAQGTVVNAGTGAATTPMEGWTAYCTSKAAARMLTQMCAQELADRGLKFFFIGIPPTDTAMQAEIRRAGLNPISRIPQGDLVPTAVPASVMAWLCGPAAREVDDVLLDLRDDRFRRMMSLGGAAPPAG